jgi:uncharacterized SAM-binding protein YcdF (DUF218 family)
MFIRYLLKSLVLPPSINIIMILFALICLGRWRKSRITLIALSTISLLALSMPFFAHNLASRVEIYPVLRPADIDPSHYQAIVILGAGRYRDAVEYGSDIPRGLSLERMRYGAYLQRKTGLPIFVSGGKWRDGDIPEAELMEKILEDEFFATVGWKETDSRTTWENAQFSKLIADKFGIKKILLVTHAWHMARAVYSFSTAGFDVTPAPTVFKSKALLGPDLFDYVPKAHALWTSSLMIHELLGLLWYQFVTEHWS